MSSEGWIKAEFSLPLTSPLDSLAKLIDQIKLLLETLVTIMDAVLSAIVAFVDPAVALIKGLLETIKSMIESVLRDLGIYMLSVPIRKRFMTNFLGLGDITPSHPAVDGMFQPSMSAIDPTNPELREFLVNANRYNGGNGGFYRTVMDSLYDIGDINRPDFYDPYDWVGGTVFIAGTAIDPFGFLDDIWSLFKIFDLPETVPQVPTPKNLKARAMTNISAGTFDVLLTWDTMDFPWTTIPDLNNAVYMPDRYAIIRGKNTCGMLSAQNILDVMGTRQLKKGDTFMNGAYEVIHEDSYIFTDVAYIDKKVKVEKDDSFYYCVAWQLKASDPLFTKDPAQGTPIDYCHISNVARVIPYPTLPGSKPPDWLRTPSVESIFPAVAELVRRILAEIEKWMTRLLSTTDILKDFIEFLRSEIQRYEALVQYILDKLKEILSKFLQLPPSGLYCRTFKGQGGMNFFLTDLAKSLLPGYPNSPPFHKGDEYVTGLVILVGGLEFSVDAFTEAFSWFVGAETSANKNLLAELETATQSLEDRMYALDMQYKAKEKAKKEENSVVPSSCCVSAKLAPVFGLNMEVVDPDALT